MSEIIEHSEQDRDRDDLRGIRLLLTARSRRWWVAVTLLLGVVLGPLVAIGAPSAERSFALVSGPVQLVMSVTLPFLGVLLVTQALDGGRPVAGSTASGGPWRHGIAVALGSVAVQVVCQGLGIGLGWVIRRPVVACLATFSPLVTGLVLVVAVILNYVLEWRGQA